jgi:clan AA aspartic protease
VISGIVSAEVFPLVDIVVSADPFSSPQTVTAVLDTGYTGALMLPHAVVQALTLRKLGKAFAILADGSQITVPVYRAFVLWHSQIWTSVDVAAADGDPLIGIGLLNGSRVTVDVTSGGSIVISPLP